MMGAVVAIGLIATFASLMLAGVEYLESNEYEKESTTRLRHELSRQPVSTWALHESVTVVPRERVE